MLEFIATKLVGSTQLNFAATRHFISQDITQRRIWRVLLLLHYPEKVYQGSVILSIEKQLITHD